MKDQKDMSFDGFKKDLMAKVTEGGFKDLFDVGIVHFSFHPLCDESSMWANKTGPNMKNIGGREFIDDKYPSELFAQKFGGEFSNGQDRFNKVFEFLIRKKYQIGSRSTSGIIENNYSFMDYGALVIRIHARSEKHENELTISSFNASDLLHEVLDDHFSGGDWQIYLSA